MVGLTTTALEGLKRSEQQLNQAATQVARAFVPQPAQDTVDLSSAAVAVLQAKNNFEANTKLIKIADQMDQTLINVVG